MAARVWATRVVVHKGTTDHPAQYQFVLSHALTEASAQGLTGVPALMGTRGETVKQISGRAHASLRSQITCVVAS